MEKKDRGRFSIKFNENDPAHQMVIDILEKQGSRKKAQFIVNAVLHYVNCTKAPDISVSPALVDKEYIETIIRDILENKESDNKKVSANTSPQTLKKEEPSVIYKEAAVQEDTETADEDALSLISATLAAFRNL